jgi:hypothetical protein
VVTSCGDAACDACDWVGRTDADTRVFVEHLAPAAFDQADVSATGPSTMVGAQARIEGTNGICPRVIWPARRHEHKTNTWAIRAIVGV